MIACPEKIRLTNIYMIWWNMKNVWILRSLISGGGEITKIHIICMIKSLILCSLFIQVAKIRLLTWDFYTLCLWKWLEKLSQLTVTFTLMDVLNQFTMVKPVFFTFTTAQAMKKSRLLRNGIKKSQFKEW